MVAPSILPENIQMLMKTGVRCFIYIIRGTKMIPEQFVQGPEIYYSLSRR